MVALCAIALSATIVPAIKQKRGRAWVESQRGDFAYDARLQSGDAWLVRKTGLPIPAWAVQCFGIDCFARVVIVHLGTDEIYDLRPLSELSHLEEIYINQYIHSQVDVASLGSLRRLRKLELTHWSGVDRKQLKAISEALPGVQIVAEDFPNFLSQTSSH